MYGNTLKSLVLLFFIPSLAMGSNYNILSDTISPEITTLPEDLTLSCGVPYQQQFDTWIGNHGGLAVSDASAFDYFNTFDENLDLAIQNSSDTLCGSTAIIPIGFYAIDDCNNVSDTAFANFIIEDTAQPIIVNGASALEIQCNEGVIDSLQNWLDNIGGAVANEVCDGDFFWNNYIWNDNLGNSGFANIGDTTNIEIIRTNCDWSVDVTFFVLDDCGNANATTSKFTIIDTVSPLILNLLTDTIIACVDTIPNLIPNFFDQCEGSLELETSIESTQGDDPNDCSFYNYSVISSFSASDICGNENSADQIVQVVDTLAPIIIANQSINIDCDADLSLMDNFIESVIDCSPLVTSFSDSIINVSACSTRLLRTWNFTDVCGNTNEFKQEVQVIDQIGPSVTDNIPSLEIECSQTGSVEEIMDSFISTLLNLDIQDNCGSGNLYINNANDPEKINFEFQYTPNLFCEGSSVLQQESLPLTLVDDCGNFEQAVSSISFVDTIAPLIQNCIDQLSFQLDTGNCEIEIPFSELSISNQCDSVESVYYFSREINLDTFNNETGKINFNWDFTPGDSSLLLDGASIAFSTQGILNNDLGLNAEVTSNDGLLVFDYAEPLSLCDYQTLDFLIDQTITSSWVENGKINFDLDYKIQEFFECSEDIRIRFKIVIPTLIRNELKYFYKLDGDVTENSFSPNDSIALTSGVHELIYIVEDCAGQRDSCIQTIEILDLEIPEINCPEDLKLLLPDDGCELIYLIDPEFEFIENCTNNANSLSTLPPSEDRFMNFTEQDNGNIVADNIQLNFTNISLDNVIINPVLIVEILANTSEENGLFSIRDETGATLGATPQNDNPCVSPQSITIDLSLNQLTQWNADGSIDFNFVNIAPDSPGIEPCSPEDFDGQVDMSSFLTATLAFTEITPKIIITNEESNDTLNIDNDGEVLFEAGSYQVELSTTDDSGNTAFCTYKIVVEDNTAPTLNCQNTNFEIDILDLSLSPDGSHVNFPIVDNCDSVFVEIDSPMISCEDIGSAISANLIASDEAGNTATCNFDFNVVGKALEPTFSSSLCGGDTLSLRNNIAGAGPLSYEWSGPNNFSSVEANPKIDDVSSSNSGIYSLIVETQSGCQFAGFVDVLIDALDIPEIDGDNFIVCEGDPLTLNSNAFSDDVLYLWYEGNAPNGNIIGMTTLPTIELNPTIGPHSYYCIVDGNGCQSEPSNSFTAEVIQQPTALVTENFITSCAGESINLSTANINPTLQFLWTGPNEFTSNEANPAEIQNIDVDQQGTYELVVIDRGCRSNPTSLEVIVFSTPDKPVIAGENILCEGSDFSLTVTNNASADRYLWFLDGELYNTTNTNSLIILSAQEEIAGLWTVFIEDDNCTSEVSDEFLVDIESQITIGANNNGPICEGGTVTLMASFIPDAQYTWTTPNDQDFIGRVVDVPAVSGIYTVEVITAAGCEGDANTIVEIIQVPEITALSNNSQNCMEVGDDISFSPSIFPPGNYEYNWLGPNGFNSTEINPTVTYQGANSNGVYSLQIRNGNCLSDLSVTEVNSTLTPPQPIITQDGALCLGDPINILASNVGASIEEYIWDTPIGQIINEEPALSISPSSNINIGDYSLSVVVNGCISASSTPINVTLENNIPTPIISGPSELCLNQELNLEVVNPNINYNYLWLTPDGTIYQGATLSFANFSASEVGNYILQAESNNCSSEFSEPLLVELISGPATPSLSTTIFNFCESDLAAVNIQDFISSPIEGEFILRNNEGDIIGISTDGNFNNLDLSSLTAGSYNFSLSISIDGCESEVPATINVIVNEEPIAASFNQNSLSFCDLGIEQIEINNPQNVVLEIELNGDNLIAQNLTVNELILNLIDFGEAELTLNSIHPSCGLFASETILVSVIDEIVANDDVFTIVGSNSAMVSILENDNYNNTPIITIQNIIDGPELEVSGPMIIINTNNFEGEFEIPYTICDINCTEVCDEALITLSISSESGSEGCRPYNVITPNADNQNDFFEIPCTDMSDNIELKIFNSFGSLIYESDDYQGDWSGTNEGQDVPVGTYYYFIKINNAEAMAGFLVVER